MSVRCFPLVLGFLLLAPLFLHADGNVPSSSEEIPVIVVQISGSSDGAFGERVVSIPVHLYIESEVKVEIRDALGYMRFESETTYPEGESDIRVGVGNMEQGLYFVRVTTDLDEQSVIVIVERPQ
ncbi:MAG: hypothetical protein SF052_12905 [Bacteroidia bacterium]|nr:hypothetical protein [Bacteroidia bacterium]